MKTMKKLKQVHPGLAKLKRVSNKRKRKMK